MLREAVAVAEGSSMRRISLILTIAFVCLAGLTIVPGALAGNFDKDKMGCPGESPAACPTATVGQPYSLTIYLTPPDGGRGEDFNCARFHVSSGAFPPGLSVSDEGLVSGTPTTAGSYRFFLTVTYDKEPTCLKLASDDQFTINVNPGAAPRLGSSSRRLAPRRERQPAVHGPGPDGYRRHGQLVVARRRHASRRADARVERRHLRHARRRAGRSRSRCRRTRNGSERHAGPLAVRPRAARDADARRQDAARDRPHGQGGSSTHALDDGSQGRRRPRAVHVRRGGRRCRRASPSTRRRERSLAAARPQAATRSRSR